MDEVIRTKSWTQEELMTVGCTYYQRKKQLVMAARLPESAAPMEIHYTYETVIAEAGDVIIFDPGTEVRKRLRDYDYWSVKYDIFRNDYRKWNAEDWIPTPSQMHLMKHHCNPFYKKQGVWAKRLTKETYIQSLESPKPQLVPAGMWLVIGSSGEPWHIEDSVFRQRYVVPEDARR